LLVQCNHCIGPAGAEACSGAWLLGGMLLLLMLLLLLLLLLMLLLLPGEPRH
jgi:hypothetical protein